MRQILSRIEQALSSWTDASEAAGIARQICLHALGIEQSVFYLKDSVSLTDSQETYLVEILERLKKGEPLQYILGTTSFCGLEIRVDSRVLIPRQETTELVEWVLQDYADRTGGALLDACTGSGCIATVLAKHLKGWWVEGLDVSLPALRLAGENAAWNDVMVAFRQQDLLFDIATGGRYEVIVSNPPYVTESERAEMSRTVLDYEPAIALFVPDHDPLRFYRIMAEYGQAHLKMGGSLYLEINPLFSEQLVSMLQDFGFSQVECRKDISGRDRFVKAVWNSTDGIPERRCPLP